jgi:hypothetical protein
MFVTLKEMLELVAYINISGKLNRPEHSECRNSDVYGAGVYWPMDVIKLRGERLECGGVGATPSWYCTIQGYFRNFYTESVQIRTSPRMRSYGAHMCRV